MAMSDPRLLTPRQKTVTAMCLFGLCCAIYFNGLLGGFLFDDFSNIVNNPSLRALDGSMFHWLALAVSSDSGLLRRPISMLSFGADYMLFGLNPVAFKVTNLAIHLVNGYLVYQLGRRLAERLLPASRSAVLDPHALALFASAAWLLHPLNVSTVLYVVQRMDELAALFTLMGLVCYAEGRERMLHGDRGMVIAFLGLLVFGTLAVFSKENGALIMGYAFVMELCCFQFSARNIHMRRMLKGWFALVLALPIALFFTYIALHPEWLASSYAGRPFTLVERVLSEARVLCHYLLWIIIPLPRWMGLFHDDFVKSTSLLDPATTAFCIAFLVLLAVTAWRTRRSHPCITFGIAWFFIGQSMESTFLPLELVFDHRNYLPMAGLLLGLTCFVGPWLKAHLSRKTLLSLCAITLAALAGTTASWAYTWGNPLRLALTEAADHPNSARAQYEAGRRIIFRGSADGHRSKAELEAVPYFERAKSVNPEAVFPATALIIVAANHSSTHTVPQAALNDLAHRVRTMRQVRINPFLTIMTAAVEGNLKLTTKQMQQLADAALANPRLNPSSRAMVLSNLGHYMFQVAHDNQAAVNLTLSAAAEDPANPIFQIKLTKLAIALSYPKQARIHLAKAKKLDKLRIYTKSMASLQERINALPARRQVNG